MAYQTINPATGTVEMRFDTISDAALDDALATARTAFERDWRRRSIDERATIVRRAAALMREEAPRLAALVVREMGKLLAQAEGEVALSASILDYYADHAAHSRVRHLYLGNSSGNASMHIEPGVVTGAKLILSCATAAVAGGALTAATLRQIRHEGAASLLARSVVATIAVFAFFEVLPHWPVGVSEVHLILGSTLFLILGRAPAAIGLAAGLLVQGLVFAPFDLPQYGMNVTTLLLPLFAMAAVADRIIPANTPYAQLEYRDVLALSLVYQGNVVAWVAFWALYGHGFTADTMFGIASFGTAYVAVVALEPLVDLAVLFAVKATGGQRRSGIVARRVLAA